MNVRNKSSFFFFFLPQGYLITLFIPIAKQVLFDTASLTDVVSTYGRCGHIINSSNYKIYSRNPSLWHPLLLTLTPLAKEQNKRDFSYQLVHDCPDTAAVWSKDLPTRAVTYTDSKGLRNTFRKVQQTIYVQKLRSQALYHVY